jgi:hypothetical protein
MEKKLASEKLSATGPDRRRHPRYRFSIPITIRPSDGTACPGMSLEISESGISVMTGASLRVGDTVELEPVASGKVLAHVRFNSGKLFGFEFLNLTTDQHRQLVESCKMLPPYHGNTLGI